jgi:1-acyl-sn-glycerol-3-phosphate acyltransferase
VPLLRLLFFLLVVRPVALVVLGLNVRHKERLPSTGPAIVAANHNSHLDALVLLSLFPLSLLPRLRPVAAADYFLRGNRALAWFALNVVGIVPLEREVRAGGPDPLAACERLLDQGSILVLFPEGSRGDPERMAALRSGVAHLARRRPEVPVVPVFLHGLGKALPRGEGLLVPFICDVFVGEPLRWPGDRRAFMAALEEAIRGLAAEGRLPPWE